MRVPLRALTLLAAACVQAAAAEGTVAADRAAGAGRAAAPCSANPTHSSQLLREALLSGGRHAARVLLDEHGTPRGDYDLVRGRWEPYEPAWHAGQLILGLLEAWRITREPELLAAARRAGDWWIAQEITEPPQLRGLLNAWHGGPLGKLINFTTVSDGTPGVYELSRETGDSRYAQAATRSGEWLLRHTYIPAEHLFYNIVDPDTGAVWKNRSPHHPHLARVEITHVARPNIEGSLLKDMCEHTGRREHCALFLEVSRATVARQHASGYWMDFEPNDPSTGRIHPRFNLWYAEALLEAHELERDPRFVEAALRTARATARLQRADGAILYDNFLDGRAREGSLTGSAVAFAGLVWQRLRALRGDEEFAGNIERSLAWLLANRFPEDHPDPNLRGGFLETRLRSAGGRTRIEYRDISTAFALRFLAACHRAVAEQPG